MRNEFRPFASHVVGLSPAYSLSDNRTSICLWQRSDDGSFLLRRRLPNGIEFGTAARAEKDHIAMDMWLRNGTAETLTDLRVQNCVMLKASQC